MSFYKVRHYPDPALIYRSALVEVFDEKLQDLIKNMHRVMLDAPGIGLAGSQVGVNLRVFTWQVDDSKGHVVNPSLELGNQHSYGSEGCLSLPDLFAQTRRADEVTLTGFNSNGEPIKVEAKGLLARVFQHEYDHINGSLFIDRISAEERMRYLALSGITSRYDR